MKKNLKFILPLSITLILLITAKILQPEKINWSDSYTSKDKIPFGCFVLNNLLGDLFPGNDIKIKNTDLPVYNTLKNKIHRQTNYIIINNNFNPDRLDIKYLIDFVSSGNNVFISADWFNRDFQDSLSFSVYSAFFQSDSAVINFIDKSRMTKDGYIFKEGYSGSYFSEYDTLNVKVLAIDSENKVVLLKMKYGRGTIFLNSVPAAFTNYYILNKKTNEFAFKSISFLKVQDVIWDEYYKAGNKFNSTPLRFIVSQPALAWAYYLMIAGTITFIIFYGRRKQRNIPIVTPLKNSTLEFVSIVGNLYYQQKDHNNIAQKNSIFFFDYLRNKYFIHAGKLDDESINFISSKSDFPFDKLKSLVQSLKGTFTRTNITESELIFLNNRIEDFYKKTGKYGRKHF